jgi:hypothetical protein
MDKSAQKDLDKSAQKDLEKAKELTDQGDEFYRRARPYIASAKEKGAPIQEISRFLEKSKSWVYDVLAWDGTGTLYGKRATPSAPRERKLSNEEE